MEKLTECEIGYLAGFIDGEGSLIISKRKHIGYKNKRYVEYSAYIDLGSTNKEVLVYIKNLVGVSSNIYENKQKGNRKIAYRLRISYKQAKPLIEVLINKLIIKKEIADVFLKYSINEDRESLWQKAKLLNKRGIL